VRKCDLLISDFGCVKKNERARRCAACLVTTVVGLILGGGCSLMIKLSGVSIFCLASRVRGTPDLSGIEKCGFEKEMSQKLRHILLSELVDWCKSESS
jgi:hypothetical protein